MEKVCPHVLHAHTAVLIEVESHVVVLNENLHIRICALDIFDKLALTLVQDVDEHTNEVGRLIVEQNNLLL